MSAAYPLVRNASDFSTRWGVRSSPSASRILAELSEQLPDEILHQSILGYVGATFPAVAHGPRGK